MAVAEQPGHRLGGRANGGLHDVLFGREARRALRGRDIHLEHLRQVDAAVRGGAEKEGGRGHLRSRVGTRAVRH